VELDHENQSFLPILKARIMRDVASSTAIETGQNIKKIEATLKSKKSKFENLKLAN